MGVHLKLLNPLNIKTNISFITYITIIIPILVLNLLAAVLLVFRPNEGHSEVIKMLFLALASLALAIFAIFSLNIYVFLVGIYSGFFPSDRKYDIHRIISTYTICMLCILALTIYAFSYIYSLVYMFFICCIAMVLLSCVHILLINYYTKKALLQYKTSITIHKPMLYTHYMFGIIVTMILFTITFLNSSVPTQAQSEYFLYVLRASIEIFLEQFG